MIYDEAENGVKLYPGSPGAWLTLGQVLVEQGVYDKATYCFQKALTIDPYLEQARQELSNLDKYTAGKDVGVITNPTSSFVSANQDNSQNKRGWRYVWYLISLTIPFLAAVAGFYADSGLQQVVYNQVTPPSPTPVPFCTVRNLQANECTQIYRNIDPLAYTRVVLDCVKNGTDLNAVGISTDFWQRDYYLITYYFRSGFKVGTTESRGPVRITNITPNTPAETVGLEIGDRLLKIDGLNTDETDVETWREYIRNKANLPVVLTIKRDNITSEIEVTPTISEGRGPIGFNFSGGIYPIGYINAANVSCPAME